MIGNEADLVHQHEQFRKMNPMPWRDAPKVKYSDLQGKSTAENEAAIKYVMDCIAARLVSEKGITYHLPVECHDDAVEECIFDVVKPKMMFELPAIRNGVLHCMNCKDPIYPEERLFEVASIDKDRATITFTSGAILEFPDSNVVESSDFLSYRLKTLGRITIGFGAFSGDGNLITYYSHGGIPGWSKTKSNYRYSVKFYRDYQTYKLMKLYR